MLELLAIAVDAAARYPHAFSLTLRFKAFPAFEDHPFAAWVDVMDADLPLSA